MSPADPRLRLRLGDAFRQIGRLDDALGQYREAALLFERLGFRRHAHAARILILKIRPDDAAALRDLRFSSNLERARSQPPLDREIRALPPREGFGPVLALPQTIAERSHHPRAENEKADADVVAQAAERAAPAAPATIAEPAPIPKAKTNGKAPPPLSKSAKPKLKTFELLLGEEAESAVVVTPEDEHGQANDVNGAESQAMADGGVIVDVDMRSAEPPLMKGRPRPKDRRSDPRVEADGEVRVFRGADALGRIEDVSESGLFIVGPQLETGTVLDLVLRVPELDWLGLARVRVARNVAASKRRAAGIGLEILWADTPTERWIEEFVARSYGIDVATGQGGDDPRKMLDESRRVFPRKPVALPIALNSPEFEVAGWAMDLSMGGAFVQAPRVFSAGRRVEAVIWLPGLGSPIRIPSVVANARTEGTGRRCMCRRRGMASKLFAAIVISHPVANTCWSNVMVHASSAG